MRVLAALALILAFGAGPGAAQDVAPRSEVDRYSRQIFFGNFLGRREGILALVERGDITLWISEEAIASWVPKPTGLRGGQRKFSDHAIETALTLRLVFNLPVCSLYSSVGPCVRYAWREAA